MDLQTYIVWKYGTGEYLLPSTMKQLLKLSKSVGDYKEKLLKYNKLTQRIADF